MRRFFRRFAAFVHRGRLRRELEQEMAAHREMMPADRQRNFGSTLRIQEEIGDQWGWTALDQFRQDFAYGTRSLRRSPSFALTAIAVLSLGIGVNLAELQVFDALLHRLRVRDLDSLCRMFRVTSTSTSGSFSIPEVEFYKSHATMLSAVIAETPVPGIFQEGDPENLACSLVSGNFFSELGVLPVYGRLLDERDNQPGAPAVAVLGYRYWQTRFASDPGIVMKTIQLNERPVQIVGVASADFGGLIRQPTLIWMATSQFPYLTRESRILTDYGIQRTFFIGRLKSEASHKAAQDQLRGLTAELRNQQPHHIDKGEWLRVQPVEIPPNPSSAALLLLSTCVLLVLLVLLSACANLGNMLMARGLSRQREIEIRLALGAGRWRLIRQLMTENLLLATLASAAALIVGTATAHLLLRAIEAPVNLRVTTDWRIVLACGVLGIGSTLAFGLAPAFQSVKGGASVSCWRKVLVSLQVTVSCVLLGLSCFLTRGVQQSFHTEIAFEYSGMTLVDPAYYLHNYTESQARQAALDLSARLRQVPGVEAVSMVTIPPMRRSWIERFLSQQLYLNAVDPSYFPMMHLPVVQGRLFGAAEKDAVVISESAARKLWPNESALGKTCLLAQGPRTVTGVVPDSGVNLINYSESVEVYLPIEGKNAIHTTIVVRGTGKGAQMAGALRSAATRSGSAPLVIPFQSIVDGQLDTLRKTVAVVFSLGTVASLLAMLGIFGLLAFTVAQRTREIGIRLALGARSFDLLECVLGQYAVPFGTGTILGSVLAFAAAKVVQNILFGFIPFEFLSFGVGLFLFAAVAITAAIVPAQRALRIDPATAVRYE